MGKVLSGTYSALRVFRVFQGKFSHTDMYENFECKCSNFECTRLHLILINRLEVADNTKTEDDFNKSSCKMTELMKEVKKKKIIKLMYLLKERKIWLLLKKPPKPQSV